MIWIGISGFQYPEWKGNFYPEKMPPAKMLAYYAERFATTEINDTFRQLPTNKTLASWLAQTPEQFRFTLKALQRITDFQRLRDCEQLLQQFLDAAMKLGSKRGALLFQLPPSFHCDLSVLRDFLALLPKSARAAFEFRHTSWFSDSVFATLHQNNAALCIADSQDLTTPPVLVSNTGYFRLRRASYTPVELQRWAELIRDQASRLTEIYVYFKHEETGTGPDLAKQLMEMLGLRQAIPEETESL